MSAPPGERRAIAMTRRHTIAATVGAALALADASVVVLALPPILTEFDASVEAVAAVIGAYTLALAAALPIIVRHRRGRHAGRLAALGMLGFALASAACGLTAAIAPLIALRAAQGAFAAVVLVAAFELLNAGHPGGSRPRAWVNAAAIGPALGGALTDLLDWRAIFLLQAPIIAAAGLLCRAPGPVSAAASGSPSASRPRPPTAAVCLAL